MREALAQYRIVGVENNVEFLARLIASPAFAAADLDTGLIEREHAVLFPAVAAGARRGLAAGRPGRAGARAERSRAGGAAHSPWSARDGWRLNHRATRNP